MQTVTTQLAPGSHHGWCVVVGEQGATQNLPLGVLELGEVLPFGFGVSAKLGKPLQCLPPSTLNIHPRPGGASDGPGDHTLDPLIKQRRLFFDREHLLVSLLKTVLCVFDQLLNLVELPSHALRPCRWLGCIPLIKAEAALPGTDCMWPACRSRLRRELLRRRESKHNLGGPVGKEAIIT